MTNTSFKLTFNKPVEDAFFKGDHYDGLKVRIEGKNVFFLPVTVGLEDDHPNYPSDVIPIQSRGDRGGLMVLVEGHEAKSLLTLLNDLNPEGRYFIIERTQGGWMSLNPHPKVTAPNKTYLHMRVWADHGGVAHPVDSDIGNAIANKSFMDLTLRDIKKIREEVNAFEAERRAGRPPREIVSMKLKLSQFMTAVPEITDTVLLSADQSSAMKTAIEAMSGLRTVIDREIDPPKSTKETTTSFVSAPSRKAETVAQSRRSNDLVGETGISQQTVDRVAKQMGVHDRRRGAPARRHRTGHSLNA